ncbi:MAG: ORF6N domain-containing protein [Candidatus Omnitrophica bacterium]|nr:ORF6N domain-containing protein [Candidatus Omnitrophota bacterium]
MGEGDWRRGLSPNGDCPLQFFNSEEYLRCQNVTSNRGGRRYMPYAFTEQGVAMLSSILRSKNAVQVNIAIMRAFVTLRELMITHKDLAHRIEALERKFKKHDENFVVVFKAIREILIQENNPKKKIGFHADE